MSLMGNICEDNHQQQGDERSLFAQRQQESCIVQRAFDVLQARWPIILHPART
jgi:hypothetical protein